MIESGLLIIIGLVALVIGGEGVVRGASFLAGLARVPPVIVGLTVVALGTSSPELAVAVSSALAGEPDLVVGNVVGSNVYNVLLVLGGSALLIPLVVERSLIRWDVPVMVVASVALLLLAADGLLSRTDGALLVGALVVYLVLAVLQARRTASANAAVEDEFASRSARIRPGGRLVLLHGLALLGGVGLLVVGANWLVIGAVAIAEGFNLDRLVIGLTVVAIGTTMPELVTSIVAAIRGERDIAVGNIVGSNLMNILAVAGGTSLIVEGGVFVARAAITFDIPVMVAVAVACLPIFFTGHRIDRWEGFVFIGYAAAYTAYLVLQATEHRALGPYNAVMLLFVVPLTVITLAIVTYRSLRRGRWRKTFER